jgi:hypothetical protein
MSARSWLAATGLLLGCSSNGSLPEPLERGSQPIIGGVDSEDADDGVVVIRVDRSKDTSVCSGAMIAPNLLLTARHCLVADYPADDIRCKPDGTLMMPSGGQLGEAVAPAKLQVFVGPEPSQDNTSGLPGGEPDAIAARILTTDWPSVCRDDIGLVVLDRALTTPIVPLDLTRDVKKSELVSVVGYGVTESSEPNELWSRRKRRNNVAVKYVDTLPNTFALGRSVCKGDSGGPALDVESGGIVGVYSLGFPGNDATACSSENALNYYLHLNRYQDLLRQAFEAAGRPFPEPDPVTAGGAGAGAGGDSGDAAGAPATSGSSSVGGAKSEPTAGANHDSPPQAAGGCSLSRRGESPGWLLLLACCLPLLRRARRAFSS